MTHPFSEEVHAARKPNYPISDAILCRWSPRAMSGESLSDEELMPLFEAARWAPSSFNNQHWRFLYAKRDTEHWQKFFDLMVEGNQGWAKHAAALVVIVSKKTFDRNDNPATTHSFDTGAAWENLAIEAASRGLVVHGMEGFDYDKAEETLNIPDDHQVEAMCAIGKRGKKEDLPERAQGMEAPNDRRPLSEIIIEGDFSK